VIDSSLKQCGLQIRPTRALRCSCASKLTRNSYSVSIVSLLAVRACGIPMSARAVAVKNLKPRTSHMCLFFIVSGGGTSIRYNRTTSHPACTRVCLCFRRTSLWPRHGIARTHRGHGDEIVFSFSFLFELDSSSSFFTRTAPNCPFCATHTPQSLVFRFSVSIRMKIDRAQRTSAQLRIRRVPQRPRRRRRMA